MRLRLGALLATAVAVTAFAIPALAQDGLLLGGKFLSASRHFGDVLGPGPIVGQQQIFGGGRFATLPEFPEFGGFSSSVVVVDGRTGQAVYGPTSWPLLTDAARPRLFEWRDTGVWSVHVLTGAATRLVARTDLTVSNCGYAYSANLLVCAAPRPDGRVDLLTIDGDTGASRTTAVLDLEIVSSVFSSATNARLWHVSPDGVQLYYARPASPSAVLSVVRVDDGQPVASAPLGYRSYWDDLNGRLIQEEAAADGYRTGLRIYGRDLSPLAEYPMPDVNMSILCAIHVSAHTSRMYLYFWNEYLRNDFEALMVVDSFSYRPLAPIVGTDSAYRNKCAEMAVLTAPGAPRGLRASVSGRDVSLAWTNVGAASHFVLDVGIAPGRTDLSVYLGPDSHASFAGVPSGTYYLRLRGGNEFGGGRPSQEVTLVVP